MSVKIKKRINIEKEYILYIEESKNDPHMLDGVYYSNGRWLFHKMACKVNEEIEPNIHINKRNNTREAYTSESDFRVKALFKSMQEKFNQVEPFYLTEFSYRNLHSENVFLFMNTEKTKYVWIKEECLDLTNHKYFHVYGIDEESPLFLKYGEKFVGFISGYKVNNELPKFLREQYLKEMVEQEKILKGENKNENN